SNQEEDFHTRVLRVEGTQSQAKCRAFLLVGSVPNMLADCAISSAKRNHVGFRVSQLAPATPTVHTASVTSHSFRASGVISHADITRTSSKAQKRAKPITPCSTSTDKKVLCVSSGSLKARRELSGKAPAPTPVKGCARKTS